MAWRHIVKIGGAGGRKRRPQAGTSPGAVQANARPKDKKAAPDEILVFSSDFKVAKQSATEAAQLLTRDETVGTVTLQYSKMMRERSLGPSVDYGGFDGGSTEDLQQVYGLDYIDGSHTLGESVRVRG